MVRAFAVCCDRPAECARHNAQCPNAFKCCQHQTGGRDSQNRQQENSHQKSTESCAKMVGRIGYSGSDLQTSPDIAEQTVGEGKLRPNRPSGKHHTGVDNHFAML